MATQWRIYGKDTVASRLQRAEIPGFLRQQIAVGPGEAAVVIHNGKVEQVITEASTQVSGFWDGVKSWGWVQALFGFAPGVEIVFVDLSPIDVAVYLGARTDTQAGVRIVTQAAPGEIQHAGSADVAEVALVALSRDKEVISAECGVRFTVSFDDAKKLAGLLKGREAISTWDLAGVVREHLLGPVLLPLIAQHDAGEFRNSPRIREQVESDGQAQLGPLFTALGLSLVRLRIAWGITEAEAQDVARNRARREEAALDFAHKRGLAEMQRGQELERTRLTNLQEMRMAETRGDEELKNLLLAGEINRELMGEGRRVDLAKIDARIREIQLEVSKREADLQLEKRRQEELLRLEIEDREFKQRQAARLAEIKLEDEEMAGMVRLQIQMATAQHERVITARRQELEAEHRRRQIQIVHDYQQRKLRLEEDRERISMTKEILSQAITAGVADSSVLRTMLEQATEQSFATGTDEKVRARADAAAAKHNLETHKAAEDRERQQQKDMTQLAAQMMQGAKQAPAATVVTGGSGGFAPQSSAPLAVNVLNAPGTPAAPLAPPAAPGGAVCPGCGNPVKEGWKVCPECGRSLRAAPAHCPACGGEVQPHWKACPSCGAKLGKPLCAGCGAELQPQWKVCPQCGQGAVTPARPA